MLKKVRKMEQIFDPDKRMMQYLKLAGLDDFINAEGTDDNGE